MVKRKQAGNRLLLFYKLLYKMLNFKVKIRHNFI